MNKSKNYYTNGLFYGKLLGEENGQCSDKTYGLYNVFVDGPEELHFDFGNFSSMLDMNALKNVSKSKLLELLGRILENSDLGLENIVQKLVECEDDNWWFYEATTVNYDIPVITNVLSINNEGVGERKREKFGKVVIRDRESIPSILQ